MFACCTASSTELRMPWPKLVSPPSMGAITPMVTVCDGTTPPPEVVRAEQAAARDAITASIRGRAVGARTVERAITSSLSGDSKRGR